MTRFERLAVWFTTAGMLLTGVVYWWMKDMMTPPDTWAVINHPWQPWMLKAHILIAPLQVFSVGMITSRHIWRQIQAGVRKGRKSGYIASGAFLLVMISGYSLQIFTAETLLRWVGWTHLGLGVLYSLGMALHRPATARELPVPARAAFPARRTMAQRIRQAGP